MKIDKVTITGADDNTDILEMVDIQRRYHFVEWGILLSAKRAGTDRYVSQKRLEKLFMYGGLKLSAHLCGDYAARMLQLKPYTYIADNLPYFDRFQINYSIPKPLNGYNTLQALVDQTHFVNSGPVILQLNNNNTYAVNELKNVTDLQFLYDSSGGTGKLIENIVGPYRGCYTGYAGGINCDNITEIAKRITDFDDIRNVWIDMESGVRTDDKLDMDKVVSVLKRG